MSKVRKIKVLPTVRIMEVPFINTNMPSLVDVLDGRLSRAESTFLVTANPEIMMYAQKDSDYLHILKTADMVIPDGIGIIIASKILGHPLEQRLAGYDLTLASLRLCAEKKYSVYFLGAQSDVIAEAVQRIKKAYPSLSVAGYHHGYVDLDDESVIQDIQSVDPDVIFVGLGFPKQELWIERYRDWLDKGLFIGVGGSFDSLAGKTKRAPRIWRKFNLEWLYRLIQHPSRWRRMMVIPVFIFQIVKERVSANKS